MLAAACLVAAWASASDARHREIPNAASAAIALLGVAFQVFRASSVEWPWFLSADGAVASRLEAPAVCVVSAVLLLVVGTAAELVARWLRGVHGMGLGDVKYLAAWTCVLGPASLAPFALACLAGGIATSLAGREAFAFAPWLSGLCLAALLVLPFLPPA